MAVLVSDSFNRANSTTTLGVTDSYNGGTAKTWTTYGTVTWGIDNNQAYGATAGGGNDFVGVNAGVSDGIITVTFSTNPSGGYVVLRALGQNDYLMFQNKGSNYVLYHFKSGWTTLGTWAKTPAVGDVIQATLNGTSITITINGAFSQTVTDNTNATGTIFGMATNQSTTHFDNFQIEELTTGGGTNATITGIIANSSADTLAPTVTTVSSVSTNIDTLVAIMTADTLNPSISTESVVISSIPDTIADTINPSVSLSGSISIQTIITDTTVDAINPGFSIDSNLLSQIVLSNADALPPQVGSFTNITVNSIITNATSDTNIPIVIADRNISIVSTIVNATADTLSVTAGSSFSAQITSVITTVTVDGIVPSLSISQGNLINSVVAGLVADTIIPMIQTDADISVILADIKASGMTTIINLPNLPEYNQVIEYVLSINETHNLNIQINSLMELKINI
jgi:hypothetical protein